MRPRPSCTEAYLKEMSQAARLAWNPSSCRTLWKPNFPVSALVIAGLLGFIGLLLWLPSVAPKFGREMVDSTTHWREESAPLPAEPEVRRATLVGLSDDVRRATLVRLPVGCYYQALLPDGTGVWTTYRGAVKSFSDLPLNPRLGDQWLVRESGQGWIWMVPPATMAPQYYLGHVQGLPTWVDP